MQGISHAPKAMVARLRGHWSWNVNWDVHESGFCSHDQARVLIEKAKFGHGFSWSQTFHFASPFRVHSTLSRKSTETACPTPLKS
jgi:hypothetical protein